MRKLKFAVLGISGVIITLTVAVAVYFSPGGAHPGSDTPLLLYNGNIITMDEKLPSASAVLTEKGRIRFVGSDAEAKKLAAPGTVSIDLKGKTLIPGFNDNHTHAVMAASYYSELNLWNKSCGEIAALVAKAASESAPGEIIAGNSWDYTHCREPHRALLDTAAPRNPVFLTQYSGHAAWVNGAVLSSLNITKGTPDPPGGQIVRDAKGEPTGVLRDTAMGQSVYGKYLSQILSSSTHRKLAAKALDIFRKAGITSVQDNTWEPFTVRLLNRLRGEGALTCRFSCWSQGGSILEKLFNLLAFFRRDDLWVRQGPIKYFADGAFSTRTGWLFEAYADEPGNTGAPRYALAEMDDIVMEAARRKRQISFHAIGDRAVHEVLNAVENAQARYPWTKELRFRLEHVQIVKPDDIPRMKRLGVIACVQPFTLNNPRKDETLLGKKRAATAYPFRSMFAAGVPVSFGSDMPAEVDYHPMLALYYAVTRKSKDGRDGPLNARECFTPREAIYCYTMGSAYAEFMEKEKGSITAGKLADMTLLSDDPTAVARESIKDIHVLMTVVGGRIVYDGRKDSGSH